MDLAARGVPTRLSSLSYAIKRSILCGHHALCHLRDGAGEMARGETSRYPVVLAESRSPLYSADDLRERMLELGKVQNLRLSCARLNGVVLRPGDVFSFWKQIGKCTRRKGYAMGRELKEGCLMPAVGGGICQLSNALYAAAADAGLEIVERHTHSKIVPGSAAQEGKDATVAWNYVDLKFRAPQEIAIEGRITADELIVRFRAKSAKRHLNRPLNFIDPKRDANSCATCAETGCHHKVGASQAGSREVAAFLVDEWWPEFDEYLQTLAGPNSRLFLPLHPAFRKPQYAWTSASHGHVDSFSWSTYRSSFYNRGLASQGAQRQLAMLARSKELAHLYARTVPIDARHLVVSLNLLPFLWEEGVLGGRTFDVQMTRQPLFEIHRILDSVPIDHPGRKLFGDFRASPELLRSESEALETSTRLITPHAAISADDPRRLLLNWRMPRALEAATGTAIAFPGPTVGRKGAYELREALQGLDCDLVPMGASIEGPDFWGGVRAKPPDSDSWLAGIGIVVQPALIEDKPRKLLQALASGRRVIGTPACGLPEHELLTIVPALDAQSLRQALAQGLAQG